jgi:hypothetical protein
MTPRALFVFLDGVGLGPGTAANPFAQLDLPCFERLLDGHRWTAEAPWIDRPDRVFRGIDANLGVPGLPQSGTGQATLFTGINCAAAAGRHFGPYPHSTSRPFLAAHNLFRQVQQQYPEEPEPAAFANAYPPRFFEYVRLRDRWTVTTRCCLDARVPIRDYATALRGEALTADLTGEGWVTLLHHDLPLITEGEAGTRLRRLSQQYRLTLFEYYLTDKAGHSNTPQKATTVLQSLDRFLEGLLDGFDPATQLLVLTSDHGNIEDLSVRTHTRNPVPLLALGHGAHLFTPVQDLTGVLPALLQALHPGR